MENKSGQSHAWHVESSVGEVQEILKRTVPAIIIEGVYHSLASPDRVEESCCRWDGIGPDGALSFEVEVNAGATPESSVLRSRLHNRGDREVRMDFAQPLRFGGYAAPVLEVAGGCEHIKALVMTENACMYGTRVVNLEIDRREADYRIKDESRSVLSHGLIALRQPESGFTLVAGALDFSVQAATVSLTHGNPQAGPEGQMRELVIELENLKPLAGGETVELSPVWLGWGRDPQTLLENYADAVSRTMGVHLRDNVPCGWISWYGYRIELSEAFARANAAVVREKMFDLGGTLCHLDLGWNAGDRPGDWLSGNERFPGGVPELCRELNAEGFQVALWTTPLVAGENSRVAQEHPDWLMRTSRGKLAEFGVWYWEPKEMCYILDPSRPEVLEHIRHIYATLRSWGATAFKLDFSVAFESGYGNEGRADAARQPIPYAAGGLSRMEVCRKLYGVIREAIGDAHMTYCNIPWQAAIGIGDSIFVADDVGNLADSESQNEFATRSGWDYFRERSRQVICRSFLHGRTWWANPDCFVAENRAPENYARARLQMVMLSGGQYKCSNRLPEWKAERMEAFLKGLPRYPKAAVPLDLFEAEYPSALDLFIEREFGSWHVLGLFNWASEAAVVGTEVEKLRPAAGGGKFLVWDFWEKRPIGLTDGRIEKKLEGESATLVGVRAVEQKPMLLATDMHYTMGGVEVEACAWDEERGALAGRARRAAGMSGNLYFYLPEGYFHPKAEKAAEGSVLILPLEFDEAKADWATAIERGEKRGC